MKEYHKIQSIFKRDEKGNFLINQYSCPEFEYLANNLWEWTEKVDGTNIRVVWTGEKIIFNGKTDNAQIPAFLFQKLQEIFPIEKFKEFPPLCLYGEGYGARIQKGGGNYKSDGVNFVLFDVMVDNWWLNRENIEDIANRIKIDVIPIVNQGTLSEAIKITSEGFKSFWGDFIAEGLVLRPLVQLFGRKGNKIITKLKYKDFKIQREIK